ncbi:MAG TPA: cation:proton antiporter [Terriglobales bacterium]|jgi:Kef-type K+ transport system membrane component KefB|nr:cation:proton antiporter [Terriglobales bacterium]
MTHTGHELLLQMLVIFVSAKVLGELFERLALPAVLGEILAGVLLGPSLLAWVAPSDTVNAIAGIGAIFLLFTVGLEIQPKELVRVGGRSLLVAVLGVVAPFALGFAYLALRGEPTHEATFVAAAMVATSVGITARLMADLKVLQTRVARIILAAAVFDDILGMVLLAVVSGLATRNGINWLQLGVLTAEALAFALFMIFVGPRLIHHMRPGLKRMSTQNAPLVLALALCLGLSVASESIGMAAIIGAFFAGLIFAEYSEEWNLHPRVNAINEFLAPFFFFAMGAKLDLHAFSGDLWLVATVITLLAVVSKVGGCGLPVLREGWKTALQVGLGMTPRGEVALIIALIGLQTGMISQRAYAIVIVMTVVTTLLPLPLLRVLFRKDAPRTI